MKLFLDNELTSNHKMIALTKASLDDNLLVVFGLFFDLLRGYGYTELQIQYCLLKLCSELELIEKFDELDQEKEEEKDEDFPDFA
jgi:hypothetical protein